MTVRESFRNRVTSTVISSIEEGDYLPWDSSQAILMRPFNPVTGKYYRGGNSVNLLLEQYQRNSEDPRWMTLNQANERGYWIRKGAKAAYVEYWDWGQQEAQPSINESEGTANVDEIEEETQEDIEPIQPRVFYAEVFNGSDVVGIPKLAYNNTSQIRVDFHLQPGVVQELVSEIYTDSQDQDDDSAAIARSELALMYLSAIPGVVINNWGETDYKQEWVSLLKTNRHELFRAARDAEKVLNRIYEKAPELQEWLRNAIGNNVLENRPNIKNGFIKDMPSFIPEVKESKDKNKPKPKMAENDAIVIDDNFVLTPMGMSELSLEDFGMVFDDAMIPLSERDYGAEHGRE